MRLDIYIGYHCENCQEALRLAELARTAPGVEVRVINLDSTTEAIPTRIFATPTYVLGGRIVSLGNPRPDELLCMLGQPQQDESLAGSEEKRS